MRNVERTTLAISEIALGSVNSRAGIAAMSSIKNSMLGRRVELFQELLCNEGSRRLNWGGSVLARQANLHPAVAAAVNHFATPNLTK